MLRNISKTDVWCRAGDLGRFAVVGWSLLRPLVRGERKKALVSAGAIIAAAGVSKVLKSQFPKRRPNGEDRESFPSQHAAEVFAAAAGIVGRGNGPTKVYGAALATAASRLPARKHDFVDVATGMSIGLTTAVMAKLIVSANWAALSRSR